MYSLYEIFVCVEIMDMDRNLSKDLMKIPMNTLSDYMNYKMNTKHTASQHIWAMLVFCNKLHGNGIMISNKNKIRAFIDSLPESWEREKLALQQNKDIFEPYQAYCELELMEERRVMSGIRRSAVLSTCSNLREARFMKADAGRKGFWLGREAPRIMYQEHTVYMCDMYDYKPEDRLCNSLKYATEKIKHY